MFIESWLIYALLACLSMGIFSFTTKVSAEREYDKDLNLTYVYFFSLILSSICLILFGEIKYSYLVLLLVLVAGYLAPLNLRLRFTTLKFISSSMFVINYRIFSSILLLLSGMFLFSESITNYQIVGVLLGFFIFYLLLEKKDKKEKKIDFKKGVKYLFYNILIVSGIHVTRKYISVSSTDLYFYIFLTALVGFVASFLNNPKHVINLHKTSKVPKKIVLFSLFQSFFFVSNLIFFTTAFITGNLGVVYKLISYSIFIPIILSIIYYNEKITFKKSIAFVLTVVSVWLFSI